ncbi:MAG TPA: ABC-2 family transporter protein [Herpetosiphonaceae bacterium]
MKRYFSLYGSFLIQRLKILMEYRVNFLIGVASTIVFQATGLLTIGVVMQHVSSLQGWSYYEVLLLYGLLVLSKSLNHMFADNLWSVGQDYIQTGAFDRFLLRPIDPLFHLLADRFCHDGVGEFLVGITLVGISLAALGITLTPLTALYLLIAVLSGGVIFLALNLITCVSAFWIMDAVPVMRVVFELHEFAKYPISMYNQAIGIFMTWLIPYAFASYYPASYLLGRPIGVGVWFAPVVATILMFIAYQIWRFGLRHYTSTGS